MHASCSTLRAIQCATTPLAGVAHSYLTVALPAHWERQMAAEQAQQAEQAQHSESVQQAERADVKLPTPHSSHAVSRRLACLLGLLAEGPACLQTAGQHGKQVYATSLHHLKLASAGFYPAW
jgi:hypothetical protein